MTVNKYTNFDKPANEQDLIAGFYAEAVAFWGIDVNYIPRTLVKEDTLFHEDIMSSFDSYFTIEAYVDSYDNYEGQDDFVAKLGLQIDDTLRLSVSQFRFKEESGNLPPKEGDLIYYPVGNALFEISFVEDEQSFYPLGKQITYKLSCNLFKYNQNDMNTGIDVVDAIETELDLSDGGIDPFASNATIQAEADVILDFSEQNPFGTF